MAVKVISLKDCRAVPLFPCYCGDDGAVGQFPAEGYALRCTHVVEPGYCVVVPIYCDRNCGCYCDPQTPYKHYCVDCSTDPYTCTYLGCYCDPGIPYIHWRRVHVGDCVREYEGCEYDVDWWELDCVPIEFRRLGPRSRALVMSLYRAIVERFFIMRSTGCACNRPDTNNIGDAFPFNPLFVAGNNCDDKKNLAGRNRRRAFGDVFRHTIATLYRAIGSTACVRGRCGVTFYPATPFVGSFSNPSGFIGCVQDYSTGRDISWWTAGADDWRKIVAANGWFLGNDMQSCLVAPGGSRRKLLCDLLTAAEAAGFGCGGGFAGYVRDHLNDEIMTGSLAILDCTEMPPFVWSVKEMFERFFYRCGVLDPKFILPELAWALRMLSVMNAQTVRRCVGATIPHKRITANITLPMTGTSGAQYGIGIDQERSCFRICDVSLAEAVVDAKLIYSMGSAGFSGGDRYYNFEDRVPPPEYCDVEVEYPRYCWRYCGCYCDPGTSTPYPHWNCVCVGTCTHTCHRENPAYWCFGPECWTEWGMRQVGGGYVFGHCASVTLEATWPDLATPSGSLFFGAPYPARWAVRECDIAFGAVSAFVAGVNCECGAICGRAWVVNATHTPAATLGNCKDLMSVLGRDIVSAGVRRVVCGAGGVSANTFSGINFPTSAADARAEMVGSNHARNLELVRRAAGCANSVGGYKSKYSALKLDRCYVLGLVGNDYWERVTPSSIWSDGKWLNLSAATGASLSFKYQDDYSWCGESIGGTTMRHAWAFDRHAARFSGFFGSFVFNNRAARQA